MDEKWRTKARAIATEVMSDVLWSQFDGTSRKNDEWVKIVEEKIMQLLKECLESQKATQ